ncbi:hypothetical protein AB0G32_11745 [Streptomyces sp. NPDC023723]|uniref:Acg family FMN-binding oxidoreductase n=1 Tax=Streptomyces sp. NPDC023723 TaxID=3154323 RepID=UPI0033FFD191
MATDTDASARAADGCGEEGLALPQPSAELVDDLFAVLPRGAALANPVTTTADVGEEQLRQCVARILHQQDTDAVLVVLPRATGVATDERLTRAVTRGGPRRSKPVVIVRTGQGLPVRLLPADHDTVVASYADVRAAARYLTRSARRATEPYRPHGEFPVSPCPRVPNTRPLAQVPGPAAPSPSDGGGFEGGSIMPSTTERVGRAALHLVRAAVLAPSPHNTQPWAFAADSDDQGIHIYADHGRRMPLTDPGGREMVIACGAALFNTRLATRRLGFRPVVDTLPDSGNAALLARVTFGAHAPATPGELLLAGAMPRRHTHRGPFGTEPVAEELLGELYDQARAEGIALQVIDEPERLEFLADLVREAEEHNRTDHRRAAELARCVGRHGVPVAACVPHPDHTVLAGRDYLALALRRDTQGRRNHAGTGTVILLSSARDEPPDWVRSGQALQRVLLYAAVHGVKAAFHTQPLEVPALRAEVRTRLTAGRFPQLLLRFGRAPTTLLLSRRPLPEVLVPPASPGRA